MPAIKYYSQHGEDFLLWEFFDRKPSGFFVDIGAFDGVHLSNSYSFEQQGWKGICVEAHPKYFNLCMNARPRSISVNAACVGDESVESVDFLTEELGLLSGITTGRETDVLRRYTSRGLEFDGFKSVRVKAVTLNRLFEEHLPPDTEIDFISIDVEGSEFDILKGFSFELYQPRVIVFEANTGEAQKQLDAFLRQRAGYIYARTLDVNAFYVRNMADSERLNGIDVRCRIEPQLHPLGERYTIKKFLNGKIIGPEDLSQAQQSQKTNPVSLGHIINPVAVGKESDLYIAQPITFESMKTAKEIASKSLSVSLFTAQFAEDGSVIPDFFSTTPHLIQSVLEFGNFTKERRLPLLTDVLGRLFAATEADYLIYTNVDIALMPQFYLFVSQIIQNGFDAFTINRRTISDHFTGVNQMPQMYSMIGAAHGGHDCFIFQRDLYPKFDLGHVCIGANWVGTILLANLMVHAKQFTIIRDAHLTFHIGDNKDWKSDSNSEYRLFNRQQAREAVDTMNRKHGPLDRNRFPALRILDTA